MKVITYIARVDCAASTNEEIWKSCLRGQTKMCLGHVELEWSVMLATTWKCGSEFQKSAEGGRRWLVKVGNERLQQAGGGQRRLG